MTTRRHPRVMRMAALFSVAALMLLVLAACGGDDDDSDPTSTSAGAASTATSSGAPAATPTAASAETPTAAGSAATATSAGADAATATTATEPTATSPSAAATATTADVATPTSGSAATATTGDDDDPLDDAQTLDPEQLPNFTLSANIEVVNTDAEHTSATIVMEVRQAAVDNYYMKIDTGDEGVIEAWRVGDRSWTGIAGTISEDPAGSGGFFEPSIFLQQLPTIGDDLHAEKVGEEEVSGRETTRYHATGEDFLRVMQEDEFDDDFMDSATNAQGAAEIWIDNELKILIKARVDVTWTNADGTEGRIFEEYDITDIGDTTLIQAPQ